MGNGMPMIFLVSCIFDNFPILVNSITYSRTLFRSVIFKTYQEMLQKKLQELKQKVFVVVLMDSNIIF